MPGRELSGVHYAMEFLPLQNKVNAGDKIDVISAKGKHVVVIGSGDTGSDCVGTSNRHGAASVTQFELMPQPPEKKNKPMVPAELAAQDAHLVEPRRRLARLVGHDQGAGRQGRQGDRPQGRTRRVERRQDDREVPGSGGR